MATASQGMTKAPVARSAKFQIKILTIGDAHFEAKNAVQTDAMAKEVRELVASRRDIDAVVVLGDVLHKFATDSVHVLSRAVSFLRGIRQALAEHDDRDAKNGASDGPPEGRQLWLVIGNHERPNRHVFLTDEHQFTALSEWPKTVIADRVVTTVLRGREFVLVPYVEPGRFAEALATRWTGDAAAPAEAPLGLEDVYAVFAHQEFYGAKLGAAGPSTIGDRYPLDAPLCISGHIHEYTRPQPNIIYTGVPFQDGWHTVSVKSKMPAADASALSLFTFGRSGVLARHDRILLKTIPRNVTVLYNTPKEFHDAVERLRANGSARLHSSVDRAELLRGLGAEEAANANVAAIRVKVRTATRDEYTSLVAHSRAIADLAAMGVSVTQASGFGERPAETVESQATVATVSNPPPSVKGFAKTQPFASLIVDEIRKGAAPTTVAFLAQALPDARVEADWQH